MAATDGFLMEWTRREILVELLSSLFLKPTQMRI
jgi:hypothetical protein